MVPAAVLVLALLAGLAQPCLAVSTFTGEAFDFMGEPGRYYSLVNTPGVQVRAGMADSCKHHLAVDKNISPGRADIHCVLAGDLQAQGWRRRLYKCAPRVLHLGEIQVDFGDSHGRCAAAVKMCAGH